ncbi:MAG: acyl carrier protein [Acidimicrobiia bacterium]
MPAETHSTGEAQTRNEISVVVRGAIAECCGVDVDELNDEMQLSALGVDDVVRLDLADILSEELGERNLVDVFDGEEFATVKSVGALIELLQPAVRDRHSS